MLWLACSAEACGKSGNQKDDMTGGPMRVRMLPEGISNAFRRNGNVADSISRVGHRGQRHLAPTIHGTAFGQGASSRRHASTTRRASQALALWGFQGHEL